MKTKSIKEQLAEAGATMRDVHFPGDEPANKWHNLKVETEDGVFDSRLECDTWEDLKKQQQQGEISDLQRQVRFPIYVGGVWVTDYRADFTFYEDGRLVVADAKGKPTREYKMKRNLMYGSFGIRIREYTREGIPPPQKFKMQKGV